MKKITIALIFILCSFSSFSQAALHYGGTAEDLKILEELNAQHANAFVTANSSMLNDQILADDFILIDNDGKIYRKPEVVQRVVASKAAVQAIVSHTIENVLIRFIAADVAMVHARIIFSMKDGTKNGTQYNDIYALRNGRWLCVAGNNSPVAATP